MSYATAADYTARFGIDEAAQLLADEEGLLTATLLQQAMAGTLPTTTPADQQAAAAAALARLTRQLANSSSFMDGYLAAAVTLPLAAGNASAGTLLECCLALTRADIADDADNATERMDDAAERWRKWLLDVSRRLVQVGDPPPVDSPLPGSGGVRSGQAATGYCWPLFGGVRW